jgi:hypothetical protein
MTVNENPDEGSADRVSLAGLDPLEVMRALLKVDPDAPPAEDSAVCSKSPDRDAPTA